MLLVYSEVLIPMTAGTINRRFPPHEIKSCVQLPFDLHPHIMVEYTLQCESVIAYLV